MKRYSFCLPLLTALSIVACIAANIVSARLGIFFGKFVAPMGVFFFPLIYVLSDCLSQVYGYRISRWVAWTTLGANILFTFGILLAIGVVPPIEDSMPIHNSLILILKPSVLVLFAGIIGAVMGGWVNDILFQWFRHKDGVEKFIKRKLISSLAAEIVDTLIFITIAFKIGFGLPWSIILTMYIVQFCMKYAVECLTAPIAKWLCKKIGAIEGNVFEDRNQFNLFGFYKKAKM